MSTQWCSKTVHAFQTKPPKSTKLNNNKSHNFMQTSVFYISSTSATISSIFSHSLFNKTNMKHYFCRFKKISPSPPPPRPLFPLPVEPYNVLGIRNSFCNWNLAMAKNRANLISNYSKNLDCSSLKTARISKITSFNFVLFKSRDSFRLEYYFRWIISAGVKKLKNRGRLVQFGKFSVEREVFD